MLTSARLGLLSTTSRDLPESPYSAVCVVIGRGYLDDPPTFTGLAHLFEHVWFTHELSAPSVEWGETRENTVVLHHACPADDLETVVAAVADRLRRCGWLADANSGAIAAALDLIGLERRTGRDRRVSGFPRIDIARALRGDIRFDPVAVDPGTREADPLRLEVIQFAEGRPLAVSVAGPSPMAARELMAGLAQPAPRSGPDNWPRVGLLEGVWPADAGGVTACAAAWILPRTPEVAAAAWLVGGVIEKLAWPAALRWVSGRVVSAQGAAPLRGGQLYAVAAGTATTPAEGSVRLVEDYLVPALRDESLDPDVVRRVCETEADAAELAALDAVAAVAGIDEVPCGPDEVREAIRSADTGTLRRFGDLLADNPRAEFHAGSESSAVARL